MYQDYNVTKAIGINSYDFNVINMFPDMSKQ